ncbi:hypothetical protein ACFQL7_17050 [Halocatena marina]|uniref:Uncharacterized protein n=1 Tax=Halocatena marina TaxID=2934937 RepID=A0ABD5YQ88_9EURY
MIECSEAFESIDALISFESAFSVSRSVPRAQMSGMTVCPPFSTIRSHSKTAPGAALSVSLSANSATGMVARTIVAIDDS